MTKNGKKLLKENAIHMINIREHSMDLKSKEEMVQSLNEEGIIIGISPGWLLMTGYEKEEVIGRFFGDFLVDESFSEVKKEFPHLKDYGFVDNVRLKLKRKDGVVVEVALNGTSKYNDDGEFERTFCELRTLNYYMNSVDEIRKLLTHEKFLKMIMYIKVNISNLLLKDNSFDYNNSLCEILNECPDIVQAIIEPNPHEFEKFDESIKSIIKFTKGYIEKNKYSKDNNEKVFLIKNTKHINSYISGGNYIMVMLINDNSMPNNERLLIIEFISSKELINEWIEAFDGISKTIELVIRWIQVNLQNINLIQQLKNLSEIDRLTNIYNRMMLDKVLLKQKNAYDRYKEKYSIIIVDIDYFKRVNDTYGHNIGDKVLYEIASLLKNNIRNTDVVGRWGGEEFLVICAHTDLKSVMILAESLRRKVECFSFTAVDKLTASFGVSEFSDGLTIEQVIGNADKALYNAKMSGRNRVSDNYR